ncbi:MAG: hypothetical protein ACK5MU_04080 [Candidatus Saccharimonadales bacterium]
MNFEYNDDGDLLSVTISGKIKQIGEDMQLGIVHEVDGIYAKSYVNFAEHLLSIPWWKRNRELKRLKVLCEKELIKERI